MHDDVPPPSEEPARPPSEAPESEAPESQSQAEAEELMCKSEPTAI